MSDQHDHILLAPVSGTLMPLMDVPDPVFAQKMLGDGVAIVPVGDILVAPAAGRVTQLHAACHAVTVTTAAGVDILMHIGLETVLLKGQGFTPKVKQGDTVAAGDALIAFDLAYIAEHASGTVTMMVVAGGASGVASPPGMDPGKGEVRAGETPVLVVTPESAYREEERGASSSGLLAEGGTLISEPVVVLNPAGFHARPAAVLVNAARQYTADIALRKDGKTANAKSVTSILGLDVRAHDRIVVAAAGADAEAAIAALVPFIQTGLGENVHAPFPTEKKPAAAPVPQALSRRVSDDPNVLAGVPASPGVVVGVVLQFRGQDVAIAEKGANREEEERALTAALETARRELDDLQRELREKASVDKAAIFAAHRELMDDPELLAAARAGMGRGESAAFAWKAAFTAEADRLEGMNNELLAGRAVDIRDVGWRVLRTLTGSPDHMAAIPEGSVLVAEDLTPSETSRLDTNRVAGFCTTKGSATSHASILARSASIPAVAAIEERALAVPDGTPVILDGTKGELRLRPDAAAVETVRAAREEAARVRGKEAAAAMEPAITLDGVRVKVVGNIGAIPEAAAVVVNGGEGVGLLRSEFLFLQRVSAPSVSEQATAYAAVAKTLGSERDLVIRTLDVGGDKPLAYLPLPPEENPFLGVRGIRLHRADPNLLAAQVRAALEAAPLTRLHIMFPMVSTVEELREARAVVEREKSALGVSAPVAVGIMVEVPSAALLAENLAAEADFFSIGTNDLTQYTLAVDRGHPRLAAMADGLHPAVLRLIAMTVEGAHKHGKWVGVCGGLAAEAEAVPVLLGLGVDELSVPPASIPGIKALVRTLDTARCKLLAQDTLTMLTAAEVREYLRLFVS